MTDTTDQSPDKPRSDVDSPEFFRQLAALMPGLVYVFNHQTMSNEYANRSVAELLGYGPDEVQAMGEELLPNIVHADDFAKLAEHVGGLQSLAADEQAVLDYRTIRRDGREIWLRSIEAVFSRAADGGVLRHVGVAFDITQEKTTEIELLRKVEALEMQISQKRQYPEMEAATSYQADETARQLSVESKTIEHGAAVATNALNALVDEISDQTPDKGLASDHNPKELTVALRDLRQTCSIAISTLDALIDAPGKPILPARSA